MYFLCLALCTSLLHRTLSENGGMETTNVLDIVPTYRDHQAEFYCKAKNIVLDATVNDAIFIDVLCKCDTIVL